MFEKITMEKFEIKILRHWLNGNLVIEADKATLSDHMRCVSYGNQSKSIFWDWYLVKSVKNERDLLHTVFISIFFLFQNFVGNPEKSDDQESYNEYLW